MKKFKISKIFKKKKRRKFSKKALGLGALGSYFLGCFKKKNHQSKFSIPSKKFRISKFFFKKKIQNFQFLRKIQVFQIKKKKKNSSLNSSSGTKSYDPLPDSLVMQHQVNCPPSAFIEAWSARVKSPHTSA